MDEVKRLRYALDHEKDELENKRMLIQAFKSDAKKHQYETEEMKRNQVYFIPTYSRLWITESF